ncbi:MAG: stage II sporulation protein P [Peptococcaceae bacterium]|nr:stage II sporulation protein P [Peptococcaceae bacterium]
MNRQTTWRKKYGGWLTYGFIAFAGLLVLLGGIYVDYDRRHDTAPAAGDLTAEPAQSGDPDWVVPHGELPLGQFFTLSDGDGKPLDYTSRVVYAGDEFITAGNERYSVDSVDYGALTASCSYVGKEEVKYYSAWDEAPVGVFDNDDGLKISIYNTHNDESYVPTEGTSSIDGEGGIIQVGKSLAEELEANGSQVEVSENKHDPHDANAYHRSRQTAVQLLKSNPDVVFDVHRDGIEDPEFYETEVEGDTVAGVRMVVGKQNPHMEANLSFAKEIKAYFDKHYPGMIKGIYMGKGNYNQDLGPRMMLLEVGTHTNSRGEAEGGAKVFGDGVSKYLKASIGTGVGEGAAARGEETTGVDKKSGSTAAIIAVVAVVLGVAFIFISRGSSKSRI